MGEGLQNAEVADLYRRYGVFLRRRCRVLLRSTSLADDALQEVFLKLMRSGQAIRGADHPLRWLYRVVDRACFDQLKKRKQRDASASTDEVLDDLPGHPGASPELRSATIQLLAALSDEEQQIAVMAFVDGMTQQEIADELGYSRMTIVKRVARIRDQAERDLRDCASQSVPREKTPS